MFCFVSNLVFFSNFLGPILQNDEFSRSFDESVLDPNPVPANLEWNAGLVGSAFSAGDDRKLIEETPESSINVFVEEIQFVAFQRFLHGNLIPPVSEMIIGSFDKAFKTNSEN
jgi:hypothetical protein